MLGKEEEEDGKMRKTNTWEKGGQEEMKRGMRNKGRGEERGESRESWKDECWGMEMGR